MDNSERDTQFQNSAKHLIKKLESIHALRMDIDLDEIEPLISQFLYDWTVHVIENLSFHDFEPYTYAVSKEEVTEDDNDILSHIPDLTEWPTPPEQARLLDPSSWPTSLEPEP